MIVSGICTSFWQELFQGVHDFTTDTFKIALFTSSASLSRASTAYSSSGEVVGTNYGAGGAALTPTISVDTGVNPGDTPVIVVDFTDISWLNSTITARGALIYNSSKANRAVCVLDFGSDKVSTASEFKITFPVPNRDYGLLRLR